MFQCSSASRKFLNGGSTMPRAARDEVSVLFSEPKIPQFSVAFSEHVRFLKVSVLFSEPKIPQSSDHGHRERRDACVSVLFSEPKIPQLMRVLNVRCRSYSVSVLFSEPKIPQCDGFCCKSYDREGFSALQRAENSSIHLRETRSLSAI